MIKGHHCTLRHHTTTHLPPILPGTSNWVKLIRCIRTILLVSPDHPETRNYLKSYTQIWNENKRQVGSYPPYIVHPFSAFRKHWEIVVFVVLALRLFLLAFDFSFLIFEKESYYDRAILFNLFLDSVLTLEIMLRFVTGYVVQGTNEIVLEPRRIAINYMKYGRVIYDLLLVLPYTLLLDYFNHQYYRYSVQIYLVFIIYLYAVNIFRYRDLFRYFQILPRSFRVSEKKILIMKLVMSTIHVLHWSACLRHILPELAIVFEPDPDDILGLVSAKSTDDNFSVGHFLVDAHWRHYRNQDYFHYPVKEGRTLVDPPSFESYKQYYLDHRPVDQLLFDRSYILLALDDIRKNSSIVDRYFASMMNTMQISLQAGRDDVAGEHFVNNVLTTFIVLGGWVWFTYILLIMIRSIMSSEISQTKFEEVVNEIKAYAFNERMSDVLEKKILRHLDCRYRMNFFNENAIMRTMSDNLRRSIRMETSLDLLRYVELFEGLPRTVVEDIVDNLKYQLYLENEVIVECGTEGDALYLIAHGTAAVYSANGTELGHLNDGAHFGDISILRQGHIRTATIVALEDCVIYRLSYETFQTLIEPYSHLLLDMQKLADEKIAKIQRNRNTLSEEDTYDNFLQ
ncbi:uncharacterized protein LOC129771107 [Toxorhynchites rutilus septentrionalis]|uniref:uncharacterized protein LOC129771107 n=1 Tax=Toxorhynchites rutilus septentrionalis TaxID=329112 RepID=UPI0024794313|nr:uncharacterized protein LOC129771107 [Toxorhynchites rutilus septentrionalis]